MNLIDPIVLAAALAEHQKTKVTAAEPILPTSPIKETIVAPRVKVFTPEIVASLVSLTSNSLVKQTVITIQKDQTALEEQLLTKRKDILTQFEKEKRDLTAK